MPVKLIVKPNGFVQSKMIIAHLNMYFSHLFKDNSSLMIRGIVIIPHHICVILLLLYALNILYAVYRNPRLFRGK